MKIIKMQFESDEIEFLPLKGTAKNFMLKYTKEYQTASHHPPMILLGKN